MFGDCLSAGITHWLIQSVQFGDGTSCGPFSKDHTTGFTSSYDVFLTGVVVTPMSRSVLHGAALEWSMAYMWD